ncbi:MAG: CDP-glycerol glycerophosphotransferase family protein [Bacillota bacterium]|uniref:CDP-glycerol glycerophosphotransferase family protein n=1 Tax=unclassified Virgibacillus TaxID=2620237 RepID=UPI000EF4BF90|nr:MULTISPECIES: CDP-glycerol glycerophosphotransferase family protein [unclassified Virgibacillus]MCC2248688.1 CDP-glycerol glycerophosphotransferase family protein [Virgibacillus sp. AGTR]MDY7044980.1 CDP-glycerol glycerophosphotransferase family protein [Virgibacillus sp. M23]QRZ18445.1 CDP-glycerol glycerophosphotransferase family protein [Virgibacillus sp. AGTR]
MNIFSSSKKKKINKLKRNISYIQMENKLVITGAFNKDSYCAKELWLVSRETDESFKIVEIKPTHEFKFEVNLDEIIKNNYLISGVSYDWYFKVRTPLSEVSKEKYTNDNCKIINEDNEILCEYLIRCGRFALTEIVKLPFYYYNSDSVINYLTTKGNLSLIVNGEPYSPTKIQIDKFKKSHGCINIEGKLFTKNSIITTGSILLLGRNTGSKLEINGLKLTHRNEEVTYRFGLNRYYYKATINIAELFKKKDITEDIYDLFLKVSMHDMHEEKYIRIGRPTFKAKLFLKDLYIKHKHKAIVVNPYYTFKKENLSFEVYNYSTDVFNYMRKLMRWSWLIRKVKYNKKTWIIGERTYKAQDTGYAFFKHIRENYPEKRVYYVIDKDSPERKNVEKYGNVLLYKSKEHILKTIMAEKIVSSHHPDYLYPIRTYAFKKKVKADKVFLQHGIMGTKNMVANYGKNAPNFDTDFFMVSSDFEKQMIVNDFNYDPRHVFVTGLSRFDTLFDGKGTVKRQLLIIPTWRDWIITDDDFLESEYFCNYKALINNKDLHKISREHNFEIIFCLHPNMQRFRKHFQDKNVRIINQGEVDVQQLIKESALMITDYSSVAFDFSFLDKPIIYYQFDRKRFIGNRPSHLDLNNDLPGEICFNENNLLNLIEEYALNNFVVKDIYKQKANKFIKYKDKLSSERIYKVISKYSAKRNISDNPKIAMFLNALFKKYRKSKYYFPSMKLFYNLGTKIIPVDKNLILFESGLGKQYGDSPKNIYEEILKQELSYKKIWVYNNNYRFVDQNTVKIKRLSPLYYYYLIRAGYWVNNQNFPSYIKKRKSTTYLQTWHGTPLKKMLFDLEEIHGRSDDYLERIGKAVQSWDYLISPSRYATKAFKSAFKYNNEILEVGYPRNDIFYKDGLQDTINKVKNRLNVDNKKVILYAPTFRDDQTNNKNKFLFNINMDLYKMKEQLGNEYIVLLRMHVVINNKLQIDEDLKDFVKNVSKYPDIQELLLVTDILITDYSSVMFDFANTGRPMLFFTYDLEKYRDNLRGFYLDFEKEAPGPFVFNTQEIIQNVLNIDKVIYNHKDNYKSFQKKFCSLEDGKAAQRVVDRIFK